MKKYPRSTLLTTLFVSILIGLGLSRKTSLAPNFWLLILLLLLFIYKNKRLSYLLTLAGIGLIMGLWRGEAYMQNIYQLRDLSGRRVTIETVASSDAVY